MRGRVSLLYMLLALPARSFSGQSPFGLATIFYCLNYETSLFVASYDSQGHGEGITSLSWIKAPIWGLRPDLLMWGGLSDERTCLTFTIAAGPLQRSHSQVRVPQDS
jgi:hypothetical protein